MGLTGAVVLLLLVLERAHPYQDAWLHSHDDIRTDLIHNLVNFWIPEVYTVSFVGGLTVGAAWLSNALGMELWPTRWPLLAQLLLALVIGEFGTYWIHRLMHENAFLWRFHAAHHSAPRLYWLNAGRFHPLDLFAQQFLALTPLDSARRRHAHHRASHALHRGPRHVPTLQRGHSARAAQLVLQHGGAPSLASFEAPRGGQHELRGQHHLVGYRVPFSVSCRAIVSRPRRSESELCQTFRAATGHTCSLRSAGKRSRTPLAQIKRLRVFGAVQDSATENAWGVRVPGAALWRSS